MGGHLLKRANNMEASQLLNWPSLCRLLVYLQLKSTFSEAYTLHLILGIDVLKNEVRLEAAEWSKWRDSSDHKTGCSTWRVAPHKAVRQTLEIMRYSLCRVLQFNVGYAHIELQKQKCPTDLCFCWNVGGRVSGWCATKHSQYAFNLRISLFIMLLLAD